MKGYHSLTQHMFSAFLKSVLVITIKKIAKVDALFSNCLTTMSLKLVKTSEQCAQARKVPIFGIMTPEFIESLEIL